MFCVMSSRKRSQYLFIIFKLISLTIGARGNIMDGCWKNNIVPYTMVGFSAEQEKRILQEIASMQKHVCIRWVDLKRVQSNVTEYVKFERVGQGECSTLLGVRVPKTNIKLVIIRLSFRCFDENAIMHEMMHALGFTHEHQRRDRNCYLDVERDAAEHDVSYKIIYDTPEWIERFPYDRYSVLHYKRSHKLKAASEKQYFNYWEPLGNVEGKLTVLDIWKLKYKYCGFPHYCLVFGVVCEFINNLEYYCYSSGPK